MATHRPNTIESLLLKPYFWWRPSQLCRRLLQVVSPPTEQTTVRLPWGLDLECNPNELIGSSIIRTGVFEMATTEAVARLADPGELALDVGANIGYMTSVLARVTGPGGHVIAYEPNPAVYRRLSRNLRRWDGPSLPQIDPRQAAVSDHGGTAQLAIPDAGHEWATIGDRLSERAPTATHRTISVPTVALDDELADRRVGLMKLDVEDHEPAALRGAGVALEQGRIRDILFEDHRSYPSETTTILEDHGYSVFDLTQRAFGIALRSPQARIEHASWEAPMRLATVDPQRALRRVSMPGWVTLRSSSRSRIAHD